MAGKSKVIKVKRNITVEEMLGISVLKNLSLKPSGITTKEKISRRIAVQTQSFPLGRVKKEFTRRNFIKETSSFSEDIMIFVARFTKLLLSSLNYKIILKDKSP
ncbi:hypothetical protein [Rivularia sp. UHCC 0363]|uniref:hypothetical protein n=1 Tax=Rivularia sp. UHCC 0363 TaxID=3110244 RepID=UPI002B20EAF9|nr:hypothetical protein [Rivularia sp. UHCC 0363]MEA5593036.1 hypothetical protein [Rivularia sp. UHCC 0363]